MMSYTAPLFLNFFSIGPFNCNIFTVYENESESVNVFYRAIYDTTTSEQAASYNIMACAYNPIPVLISTQHTVKNKGHRYNRNNRSPANILSIPRHIPPSCEPLYPENISMAILNIRSLSGKTFLINDLICERKLDCMFLTETWLNKNGSAALIEASPPNYSFFQSIRTGKKGGGTATITTDALCCRS